MSTSNIKDGLAHGASLLAELSSSKARKKAESYAGHAARFWEEGKRSRSVFLAAAASVLFGTVSPDATPQQLEDATGIKDEADIIIPEVVDRDHRNTDDRQEKVEGWRLFFTGILSPKASSKASSGKKMPVFIPILLGIIASVAVGTMIVGIGFGLVLAGVVAREIYTRRNGNSEKFSQAAAYTLGMVFAVPTLLGDFMWFAIAFIVNLFLWDHLPIVSKVVLVAEESKNNKDSAEEEEFPHEM